MSPGEILGVHHIKIPVSDLPRSRAWYERVFDLEPRMEFRDDHDGVVRGVSYRAKGELAKANPQDKLQVYLASDGTRATWSFVVKSQAPPKFDGGFLVNSRAPPKLDADACGVVK